MALTNALNWNEDLPGREKIAQITSALTHTITYGCIKGAIDGHPSISPHNNIGSRGIAITMMINEPMNTKPNAILAADGIVLISTIPPGTQIQAFYGNSYEELRKLQDYTITTNPFFHTELGSNLQTQTPCPHTTHSHHQQTAKNARFDPPPSPFRRFDVCRSDAHRGGHSLYSLYSRVASGEWEWGWIFE